MLFPDQRRQIQDHLSSLLEGTEAVIVPCTAEFPGQFGAEVVAEWFDLARE